MSDSIVIERYPDRYIVRQRTLDSDAKELLVSAGFHWERSVMGFAAFKKPTATTDRVLGKILNEGKFQHELVDGDTDKVFKPRDSETPRGSTRKPSDKKSKTAKASRDAKASKKASKKAAKKEKKADAKSEKAPEPTSKRKRKSETKAKDQPKKAKSKKQENVTDAPAPSEPSAPLRKAPKIGLVSKSNGSGALSVEEEKVVVKSEPKPEPLPKALKAKSAAQLPDGVEIPAIYIDLDSVVSYMVSGISDALKSIVAEQVSVGITEAVEKLRAEFTNVLKELRDIMQEM